jgi:hypothetical protein
MLFDDRHRLPTLQAGAKLELCFYVRRRLEPAPSGGGSLLCEERSDVAIRNTVPCALDCHVATLLAMTEEGAMQAGDCAEPETCNP